MTDKGPGGHILTGPIYVEGADSGDVLEVRILEVNLEDPLRLQRLQRIHPRELRAGRAARRSSRIDAKTMTAEFAPGIMIPLKPFFGSMGVAPPPSVGTRQQQSAVDSRRKPRQQGAGRGHDAVHPGARAPARCSRSGDGHAAQGDGEVDQTAIETSLRGKLQLIVRKDMKLAWPHGRDADAHDHHGNRHVASPSRPGSRCRRWSTTSRASRGLTQDGRVPAREHRRGSPHHAARRRKRGRAHDGAEEHLQEMTGGSPVKTPPPYRALTGGGGMGALMRAFDWARTPVGPIDAWPQSLRTALSILLDSRYPMYIAWGPQFVEFYNDAFRPILGTKHPRSLGGSSVDTWSEIWPDFVGPLFNKVRTQGEATYNEDLLVSLNRFGYTEECYFTFCYSPIREESGAVGGVLVTCMETTARVVGERRLRTLRELRGPVGRRQDTGRRVPERRIRARDQPARPSIHGHLSPRRGQPNGASHRIVRTRRRRRRHSRRHRSHRERASTVATA